MRKTLDSVPVSHHTSPHSLILYSSIYRLKNDEKNIITTFFADNLLLNLLPYRLNLVPDNKNAQKMPYILDIFSLFPLCTTMQCLDMWSE